MAQRLAASIQAASIFHIGIEEEAQRFLEVLLAWLGGGAEEGPAAAGGVTLRAM